MPGVAFVAHCLLNQNSKPDGGARCPGVYSPLVAELRARGWRMEQMPCPELAFTGLNRFWAVREQLDTSAYRRHCARLATAVAAQIEHHVRAGDDVVLVGLEGSPSLGVHVTSSDPERGGRPVWPEGAPELSPGTGIFIDELAAALRRRGLESPRAMGISHQLPDHDEATERAALVRLLEAQVEGDDRGFRVALVRGDLLNAPRGQLDAVAALEDGGWGIIQVPARSYPEDVAAPLLEQVAEQAEEFVRHGYRLVVVGDRDGLADALAAYGLHLPPVVEPRDTAELRGFLARAAE